MTTVTTAVPSKISSLKTKLSGAAGIIVAVLIACQKDPHFAKWAIVIGVAANAIGNFFSRANGTSDQDANVRPPVAGVDPVK